MFVQKTPPTDQTGFANMVNQPCHSSAQSIEMYAARRSYAFDQAEEAYWHQQICAEAYMLFRLLTRLCKDRTYCWAGLDYLAERLQISVGTIKRRLDVLERAGLITRKQRPGGLTSYTYIQPLQDFDMQHNQADTSSKHNGASSAAIPVAEPMATTAQQEPQETMDQPTTDMSIDSGPQVLFFAPTQEISCDPTERSKLIHHTVKSQTTNLGGGGRLTQFLDTPTVKILKHAGVVSPTVLAELQHYAQEEAEACVRFALQQRNILDPAAFAVSLLRQNIGGQLLQRPARFVTRNRKDVPTTPLTEDTAHHYYFCAHGRLRGTGCIDCQPAPANMPIGSEQMDDAGSCNKMHASAITDTHTSTSHLQLKWQRVKDTLRSLCSAGEYVTWLQPTVLLQLDNERAVIGTSNVFAREHIATHYADVIARALSMDGQQPRTIEVVIAGHHDLELGASGFE